MNTSQSRALSGDGLIVLRQVLVVTGALFGLALLSILLSGTANASDRSPEPGGSGLLGDVVGAGAEPVMPLLESVAKPVHRVASEVAPVVEQVTKPVEPVLSQVVRPVAKVAEPVLRVLEPVTGPVTRPLLDSLAPVTEPVAHAVGAERVITALDGEPSKSEQPAVSGSASRSDVSAGSAPSPAIEVHSGLVGSADSAWARAAERGQSVPGRERPVSPETTHSGEVSVVKVPGPAGGGPALPSGPGFVGVGGSMSASSGGSHGGEYAVTESGTGMPGTDRAWRAPPDDRKSVPWPDEYGHDHPS
ncbi:hypothetical protein [Amycolatopsis sp. lyj-90]|uniref:hypothetical protein n=1 Tax=Amycolatopsis sp. lyj-90 TaxID=2789285 RepID=UPI00397BEDBE